MSAHAVDDDHQQRVVRRYDIHSILIFRPIARQSQLCIIHAHA
jgi:hypothetical protein